MKRFFFLFFAIVSSSALSAQMSLNINISSSSQWYDYGENSRLQLIYCPSDFSIPSDFAPGHVPSEESVSLIWGASPSIDYVPEGCYLYGSFSPDLSDSSRIRFQSNFDVEDSVISQYPYCFVRLYNLGDSDSGLSYYGVPVANRYGFDSSKPGCWPSSGVSGMSMYYATAGVTCMSGPLDFVSLPSGGGDSGDSGGYGDAVVDSLSSRLVDWVFIFLDAILPLLLIFAGFFVLFLCIRWMVRSSRLPR